MPVRRDHARQRVRDLGVLARRPHLHEGHAARRADQARPDPGSELYDTRAGVQDRLVGNFLVWVVWLVAAGACLGTGVLVVNLIEPLLLGAGADREPVLARRAVPARSGRVRRGHEGRLRRRGDGHVPVRHRVPRRPCRRRGGAALAAARGRRRRGCAAGGDDRGARPEGGRRALGRGGDRRRFEAGGDREALPDGSAPRRSGDHLGRPAGSGRRRRPRHARSEREPEPEA